MTMRYELAANTIGDDEINAAIEVLRSGRLTMGSRVKEFERKFADWTGAKHALMVNSGSSANLLAVESKLRGARRSNRRWESGDEVLVPALAWPTTVWPIAQLGLVPVLVDVDPTTLAIDLESANTMVGPRTVGMFLIHVLGQAPIMDPYLEFCSTNDIDLIEDSCESLGAHSSGTHVGNFGEMGTFSTYFSHHITTIEGGVIVTADDELIDDLRSMRAHGWVRDRSDRNQLTKKSGVEDDRFLFVTTGYNVRPNEIQAAIGLIQLERLPAMLEARTQLARKVADLVESIPWLRLIGSERFQDLEVLEKGWRSHSWMTLPFRVAKDAPLDAQKTTRILEDNGIETRTVIAGNLANHPAMSQIDHRTAESLKVADDVFHQCFMIGCHPTARSEQIETLEAGLNALADL